MTAPVTAEGLTDRHQPDEQEPVCGAEMQYRPTGAIHVCEDDPRHRELPAGNVGRSHACRCGVEWSEPSSSPVTAEESTVRMAAALLQARLGDDTPSAAHLVDARRDALAVMAALAGDPGDLPARMAEMLMAHEWEPGQWHTAHGKHNFNSACAVCQGDVPRIAAAAMSARSEDTAALAAENAELRARLHEAAGNAIVYHQRMASAQNDRDRHRAVARAATERAELADVEVERLRTEWDRLNDARIDQSNRAHDAEAEVERLRAELAEAYLRVNNLSKKEDQQFRRAEKLAADRDLLRETLAKADLGGQVLALEETVADADRDRDRLAGEVAEYKLAAGAEADLADEAARQRDALKAAIEGFLRSNAERLRSGDITADLADLAEGYWKLAGWTALAVPETPEETDHHA